MIKKFYTLLVLAVSSVTALAQISITNSTPYTQNFNNLHTSGTVATNPIPDGWCRYANPASAIKDSIRVTTGSTTSGGFYSVGATSDADRAFGLLLSSATKPLYLGAQFTNNTGSTIVSANISYNCEQWRRGNNTAGLYDTLKVEYSTNADSVYKGAWTQVVQLTGRSVDVSTTVGALDGNTQRTTVSYNLTGLAVPNGGTFWLRFNDYDIPGSEDLLGVDDFSIAFTTGSVSPCTEPATSVTTVTASGTGSTSIGGSFTGVTADGYVVVADSNATVPALVDGMAYSVGQALGTGKVIGVGTSTSFTGFGLVASTTYHVYVIPYNSLACSGGPNYKLSSPGHDTAKTFVATIPNCTQPTGVSTSSIVKLDSTGTTISIKWTNPANADSVLVFAAPTNTVGFVTLHDSVFYGVGATIPSDGATPPTVYYRGTDSSKVLTGLTPNTVYKIFVVSFNGKNCNYVNYAGLANVTIRTAVSTGVKVSKGSAFTLFPNPVADNRLYIRFSQALSDEANLEVVDMLGRKVLSQRVNANVKEQTIDVAGLGKGMYYINVWYKGDNSTVPFIVQ